MTMRSYLWETPPFCPTAACYVHGMKWDYAEHHVEGCPLGGTVASSMHRLTHSVNDAAMTIGRSLQPAIEDAAEAMRELWRSLPLTTRAWVWLSVRWDRIRGWLA